ncbi:MAG: diguanylate cyclase [Candidatus Thiodiazotropha sp.]
MTLKRPNSGTTIGGISVSIGVATYRMGEASEDFLHRCDQALYSAKSRGRNRVVLAD